MYHNQFQASIIYFSTTIVSTYPCHPSKIYPCLLLLDMSMDSRVARHHIFPGTSHIFKKIELSRQDRPMSRLFLNWGKNTSILPKKQYKQLGGRKKKKKTKRWKQQVNRKNSIDPLYYILPISTNYSQHVGTF